MISYFKDFLLNIFIIFSPLFFYPYIYRTKSNPLLNSAILYILFSIALILTMSFPVSLNGLTYDFRSIPLVIGSLYGGPRVSLLLFITLILNRHLMGSPHNLIYAISLLPNYIMVLLLKRGYGSLKLYQKIVVAIVLCTSIKLVTFMLYLSMTEELSRLFYQPITTIQTYLLQALIAGLCVYLIEFLNTHFRMQEEMITSEKSKIVSDMAAAVAHEIRNPLTTVRGFIQLLGDDDLDRQKKLFYQNICLDELDRAQLIITDYLSLAKPDPETIEQIILKEEISHLTNLLLTYANYKNIQVFEIIPEEPSLRIMGDRYKFRQALINIGKNAIEALHGGGILEIKAYGENEQVIVAIRDTGVGMTPEQVKRLGTPYYSTKEKGTGLGTMVSFEIIKKMNGKIEITSELGTGTTFKLFFPKIE